MIRAIIFDFDGLILDTETHEFNAYAELYREHGAQLTLDYWGRCIGTQLPDFDPIGELRRQSGTETAAEVLHARRRRLFEQGMAEADLRPGVRDYLGQAKTLRIKVGLASSSSIEWVEPYLRRFGIYESFDALRTRHDVKRVKPDPELYVQACSALGVKPEEAVAFEDSPNGALAAKRAGMRCVAVPNEVTSKLVFGDVDLTLSSMSDMALNEVLMRLQQAN